jgi:VWFA-related protein
MIAKCPIIAAAQIPLLLALGGPQAAGQSTPRTGPSDRAAAARQVRVPSRPAKPLYEGSQGKQGTEIHFDRSTGLVTLKMLVQDPNGYFIPNIRRENFVVYENGARQRNASVEIEHAPVSIGLLLEYGGRYQALNKAIGEEVSRAAHGFLEQIGRNDTVAVWKYGDTIGEVSAFTQAVESLESGLAALRKPPISELNFYDALVAALDRMRPLSGRKALIVITTGLDTFSKAAYQDALAAATQSGTPIYVIHTAQPVRESIAIAATSGPYARLDWKRAGKELQELATASGGRLYSPQSTLNLTGIYDDLMENLRVRYVITYRPAGGADLAAPRTVRVELLDPAGGPLEIVDANGRVVRSKVFVQDSYVPQTALEQKMN